ncbi:hypothetical protein ES319_D10G062300v1 [Gossypium barbadense]|uniref:Uncharacterized protein n=1 Tax=Gossypium barbadense TaxID=3634 RepID=A0A5J5PM71_GOSBA|nr:hypothetical protein ES319_D10G062300v1 [Gossypium barbadense]PPD89249.1 hypothetical protein GOBAR_DD13811 [Gossypium barbadense]
MEEFDEDMTPFWLRTTDNRRLRRRHLLFNTGIIIILLLAVAFAFIFIIIPSFLSFTSKIFKPQLVKKSWDSLNLVLVLFAIICAFLSKSNGDNDANETPTSSYQDYKFSSTPRHVDHHVRSSTPGQWSYDHALSSDRTAYNSLRRMRSSSSYPDLRQESTGTMNGDDRWRFYDDTGLYNYRSRSRREHDEEQVYLNNLKDIAVDTVHRTSPQLVSVPPPAAAAASPPTPPQSPPPQPPKAVRRKPKRAYEDVRLRERSERKEDAYSEVTNKYSLPSPSSPPPTKPPASPPPPPPHPPPPPPPPPPISGSEKRSKKSEKKRGGVTKEFLTSLRRKKKKQRQRSVENLDEFFNLATLPLYPPPSPPPPPPPPPLPSFYNIFSSKKNKARKHHSTSPPPTLPPSMEARASKREPNKPPVTTIQKPPLPVKIRNVNNVEENVESGNESPFNTIPPPPPPPPFKMPAWKFEVHGDFVRLKSINSSRSGSPDLDDPLSGESSPADGNKTGRVDGGESMAGPLFCPSPDVNTKADHFIARFRAGLKLEKINSVKGRSNLGLDPGPSSV